METLLNLGLALALGLLVDALTRITQGQDTLPASVAAIRSVAFLLAIDHGSSRNTGKTITKPN